MRVLVIGGGGREHALIWKIKQSPRVREIFCIPGNGGIARDASCLPGELKNIEGLVDSALRLEADLTIVGPELPLTLGIVDEFQRRGLRIFGPTRLAACLEGSKAFAKEFMQRHHVPTAHYAICLREKDVADALPLFHPPIVVKADGLAAGKGVVIANTRDEAAHVAREMLSHKLVGAAGHQVVIEEFLQGEELSFLVLSDGENVIPLVASRDHKRIGDGDTGPNTGGMGAYSTDDLLDGQMQHWIVQHVAKPVIRGMKKEGAEYRGVLYCGLMMTARGPMVLEFNCRFGDPETQAVLPRLESDLVAAIDATIDGGLHEGLLSWSKDASVCIVAASSGYPGTFETGKKISGLERAEAVSGVQVFHAGTSLEYGQPVTSGGRVLGVTARAKELAAAVDRAYRALEAIHFDGIYFRKDIAARALSRT
jgi:phosphoribosylamine---glycine ligase